MIDDYIFCPNCKTKMFTDCVDYGVNNFRNNLDKTLVRCQTGKIKRYVCRDYCIELIGYHPYIMFENNSVNSFGYLFPLRLNNKTYIFDSDYYIKCASTRIACSGKLIIKSDFIPIIRNNNDINAHDVFTRLIKLVVFS